MIVIYRSILGLTPHTLLLATVGPAGLRVIIVISVIRRLRNVVAGSFSLKYDYSGSHKDITIHKVYGIFIKLKWVLCRF